MFTKILKLILFIVICIHPVYAVTSPQQFLHFTPGDNYKLISYKQLYDYFHLLAKESPRIECVEMGTSTQGNPMFYAIISSPNNLSRTQEFQHIQQALTDHSLLTNQQIQQYMNRSKSIVSVNCSIHAFEIGSSQMAPLFAYELAATQDSSILAQLENVILLLVPSQNPDGMNRVVDWYNEYLGTGYEKGPFPFSEHPYMGHSINRDWFALTQKETRNTVTQIYNKWFPHIVVDLHQLGKIGPRMVVPPYIDPYDELIHPLLQAHMAEIGTFIMTELTSKNMGGVTCNLFFDAYSPSRAYTNYHNGCRILVEVAAADLASPVPVRADQIPKTLAFDAQKRSWRQPKIWDNTAWTFADVVSYFKNACYAVLKYSALQGGRLVQHCNAITTEVSDRSKDNSCFIVSKNQFDEFALQKFLSILLLGKVQIFKVENDFTADGKLFPKGSFIIPSAQPFGYYVKTLLRQRIYPMASAPGGIGYSGITSHNLALMFGIDIVEADMPGQAMHRIDKVPVTESSMQSLKDSDNFIIPYQSSRVLQALPELLRKFNVFWLKFPKKFGESFFQQGSFYIAEPDRVDLERIARDYHLQIFEVDRIPKRNLKKLKLPHFAIYKSYIKSEEEGWLRFLFDQMQYEYTLLDNQAIRTSDLTQYSALLIPSQPADAIYGGLSENLLPDKFTGGLGKSGTDVLLKYVENGGTLITLGLANDYIRHYFPVHIQGLADDLTSYEYQAPGVHLKMEFEIDHPLAYGMPSVSHVFAFHPPILKSARFEPIGIFLSDPLKSGWMIGQEYLANSPGFSRFMIQNGSVILISFRPYFRAQSYNTIKIIFNSLLESASVK